ncbi:MAG: phosphomannomutase/phosphoglucomutase, partial [Nanoarchaeota archaeon]|nr:phosphomannomutase/phosphoglucomutase [Nanoarchaeota archaeon]
MAVFKAYDVRGIYPEELNEELAYKVGRAFVKFVKVKEVVVGRDARISSDSLFEALTKGITDEGANVINIGMVTTPMLYFGIANYGHESGIMITASHNPKQFNGFKLCKANAVPISGDTGIKDIQRTVEENNFGEIRSKGGIVKKDVYADYEKHVLNFLPESVKKGTGKQVKIVIDCSNGASGPIIKQVFSKINCDATILFTEPDGNFPNHEANP